jgi:LacI family transcriptional regulator
MRKPSKLSEVAKLAGVSPITASRAIRGVGYVSEAARARIMEAAASLNYTPDMLARRMRGDKSNLIGVFVNNYGSVVLHEIIRTISHHARPRGYDLIIFNAERFDGPERMVTSEMLSKLCDGLLLVLPTQGDGYLGVVNERRFPCVVMNFEAQEMRVPVITVENRQAARTATEHLLSLGHRRIGFIAGTNGTGQSAERYHGYCDALNAAGVEIEAELCVNGAFNQTMGYAATEKLMAQPNPPTAIFAANDEMAFGAMDALKSRGLSVPDDVSVIGFDDIPASSYVFPKLTTMRPPYDAMSERAVSEVIALIQGGEIKPGQIRYPLELVTRNSTAPLTPSTEPK